MSKACADFSIQNSHQSASMHLFTYKFRVKTIECKRAESIILFVYVYFLILATNRQNQMNSNKKCRILIEINIHTHCKTEAC